MTRKLSCNIILSFYCLNIRRQSRESKSTPELVTTFGPSQKQKLDSQFYAKLQKILKILIPKWLCPETGYMGLISGMLVVRSLCDVWTIYLGTLLESAIITHDNTKFNRHLIEFAMTMPLVIEINIIRIAIIPA
jgi:ATP-binding cassette subfamily D (ALD) protein 3